MLSEELRSLGDECGSSEMNQPLVTPYTEASRQDIQSEIIPQVSDPLPPETNESIIPAIRQSQRSTKGIGKKQYEQKVIPRSSAKAEFLGVAHGIYNHVSCNHTILILNASNFKSFSLS